MKKIIFGVVVALLCCSHSANAISASAISESVVMTAQSTDWDKLLNDYENYVNQYIKTYQKAMNGDMTAMAEYAKLLDKAQKLSEKLDKAKGEMTTAQLQRYTKLTQKMLNAIK